MKLFRTPLRYISKTTSNTGSLFLILIAAIILFSAKPIEPTGGLTDAHSIIYGMFKSIDNVKTLQYLMINIERMDEGKTRTDSGQVKSLKSPHKIFMRTSSGDEVLWVDGANNGNAWVHPNSFPYITLSLDPNGSIMRKNQHHSIREAGYDYFKTVLQQAADKNSKTFDSHFLYLGEITFNGTNCYNIIAMDKDFKYFPYQVQKGENVITIAKKFWVNECMIVQHNKLSSFTDVSSGQTIMIPSDYGKLITLYIDEKSMLPLLLRVDDEKGLFEQYVFKHIKIDPLLTSTDFSKDSKEYHFQ